MSNDNKTLADVQPGGRVRLGDGLLQKAYDDLRYYVDASPCELAQRGISREDALDIARESEAALSAQTSTGETLPPEMRLGYPDYLDYLDTEPSPGGQGEALPPLPPKDVVDTHLPTGVRIYGYTAEQMQGYARAALAARQPVGADDATDRALGEAIEQRDRCEEVADELADHIARITGVDIGEHSSANCPWQNAIEAAEEYQPALAVDLAPRPMATAPHDGTMVRLLVQFKENATEDTSEPTWTIGACNDDNVGEDERIGWQFAGWCWTHDHFTEGKGTPVGWLPMIDSAQAVDPGQSIPSELAPVAAALKRFGDCAEDSGSEGCDIGRDWFDALTTIGLLSRTQRSPAVWTMTAEGERLLALIDSQAVGNG